jgi:hypothetical protein
MKLLSYADIMESGASVFTCSAQTLKEKLVLNFKGEIRIEHPYKYLADFLEDLAVKIKEETINETEINFIEFKYCNSNGFYILMDIIEIVYQNVTGKIIVRRIKGDDWQNETLPILLDLENTEIAERTLFLDEEKI